MHRRSITLFVSAIFTVAIVFIALLSTLSSISHALTAQESTAIISAIRSHFIRGAHQSIFDRARAQRVVIVHIQQKDSDTSTALDGLKREWREHYGGNSVSDVKCRATESHRQCLTAVQSTSDQYPHLAIFRVKNSDMEDGDITALVASLKEGDVDAHTEYHVLSEADMQQQSKDYMADHDSVLPTDTEIAEWQIQVWTSLLLVVTIAASLYTMMSIDYSKDTAHYAADVMD